VTTLGNTTPPRGKKGGFVDKLSNAGAQDKKTKTMKLKKE